METSAHCSRSLLPACRIAATVEAGDNGQRVVGFDNEHERVGKAAKQGAAHIPVDHGELPGARAHALDHGVNCLAETSAQAGGFVLVPVLRVDQFRAGRSGEDNRMHYGQRRSRSAFNASQVMPSRRS